MKDVSYKKPSDSQIIKTEVVCPNDTNPMGILKGGHLVEWMDVAAVVCAQTHAGKICVTASIYNIDFKEAAKIGDIITIFARITRVFTTSMEILVQAFARKVLAKKNYLISEAYFTFVALNKNGKAAAVIGIKPVTQSEKEQYGAALKRKRQKIHVKKKGVYPV